MPKLWNERSRAFFLSLCGFAGGAFVTGGCPGSCGACPGCGGLGGLVAVLALFGFFRKSTGRKDHGMDKILH